MESVSGEWGLELKHCGDEAPKIVPRRSFTAHLKSWTQGPGMIRVEALVKLSWFGSPARIVGPVP